MKKQRKRPQQTKRRTASPASARAAPQPDRRATLKLLRNLAIAAPVLGIGGYVIATRVLASIGEHDLGKIGDGRPAVVQVHDPQCDLCVTLQRQTRRALRAYDADRFHYLVANITSLEGELFARRHGVGHVTLVLLDGAGEQVGIIRGPLPRAELDAALAQHLGELS